MPVDLQRIIEAAAQAVLTDSNSPASSERANHQRPARRSRRRLTGARTFLIGAGIVTAGRLVSAARRGDVLDGIQQRLLEYEHRHFGEADPAADAEYEDEGYEEDEDPEPSESAVGGPGQA